jgi:hypothetical protein
MVGIVRASPGQSISSCRSQRLIMRCLALAAWLVPAACAPSLGSVRTTAGLGLKLGAFEGAFDLAGTYCRYTDRVSAPDPKCPSLRTDADNWHAVNRALVGYAAALAAMADDSTDKNEQASIATALGAAAQLKTSWSDVLAPNVTSGVSQGVSTLISGIVGVYRRERLGVTIRSSNDALQAVARGIAENVALLDRADRNLLATIDGTISSVQIGNSPAADKLGLTIALSSVATELTAHRLHLASYKAAIDSFAKAHDHLRKKLSGLGDPKADIELLKLIATDVATIVNSARTVMTPPAPAPPPAS